MKIEAGAQVTPNVRLLRRLGEGGMGEVWAAEHLALGTEVAVKFLLGDYASDPAVRSRFSQEAAAASQVKSSHVVKVYDYGVTDGDVPFIVMEMLEGGDLAHRLQAETKISPAEVLTIVRQLCKALERAHEKGIIHRDIKPENVFLGSEGGDMFVKLLDFGIAKTEAILRKTTGNRRSTMAGESLGTPYYMSPEQFRSAKQIDTRSDLWSVGVLVYEALTGVLPFEAETVSALAIIVNEAKAAPPTSVDPALPASIDAWFAKACARDAADRFQTARELSNALAIALGVSPESDANTSAARRVVISHVDASEADAASLRDTAFATSSGGPGAVRRRRVLPIALGAIAITGAVVIGVWVTRHDDAPSTPTHAVSTTTALAIASSPATTAVELASAIPHVTEPTTTAKASASVTPTTHVPAVHPSAGASASSKGDHHGDIW